MKEDELEKYKASLEKKTLQELEEIEKQIIEEADKIDRDLTTKTFDLPKENYEIIAEAIRYFLDKQSVQFQYALGLAAMWDFWDPKVYQEKIPYPQLDSILRLLGQQQYTGYVEWAKVIAINKYFEPLQQDYIAASQAAYDIASKHNEVIDAIQKHTPLPQKQINS